MKRQICTVLTVMFMKKKRGNRKNRIKVHVEISSFRRHLPLEEDQRFLERCIFRENKEILNLIICVWLCC